MKGRKTSRWHTILFTVCVCFFIGAIIGAFSAAATETEQIQKLGEYSGGFLADAGFRNLFIKHGKYILGIWLSGFIYSGAVIVIIIIFVSGIFYGFSSTIAVIKSGISGVLSGIFPQSSILIPLYILTAVWTMNFVLDKFTYYGPKSRIKRERRKHLKEHLIILVCALAVNSAACIFEIYIAKSILI